MSQKYNTSGYPLPTTSTKVGTYLSRLQNGVETVGSCYGGDSDPSSGGTWDADQVGQFWFDRTNEIDNGGDDLGGTLKRYEKTGATPTYEMRTLGLRGYFAKEANVSLMSATGVSTQAFTDLDISGATASDRAVAVRLLVEVKESNPGAGINLQFRKNGTTTDALTRTVFPQVGGISVQQIVEVEVDGSGLLEYAFNASGTSSMDYSIAILGYWERV